jgi:hypothetical protein
MDCITPPPFVDKCHNVGVSVTVRLDDRLAERLRLPARAAGGSLSDRLRRYAEEGARRDEHPTITFQDGLTGRPLRRSSWRAPQLRTCSAPEVAGGNAILTENLGDFARIAARRAKQEPD